LVSFTRSVNTVTFYHINIFSSCRDYADINKVYGNCTPPFQSCWKKYNWQCGRTVCCQPVYKDISDIFIIFTLLSVSGTVFIFAATMWNTELKLMKFYNRELFTFHSRSASLVCHRLSRKYRGSNIQYIYI
jgi:hypothetical protein